MQKQFYVYILTNKINGTLYVGVTNDLVRRGYEHKNKLVDGFSKKHDLTMLVYYECFNTAPDAIHREKCIKKWNRAWKLKRIHAFNPKWEDLYEQIAQ
ncbi:MAG: GIY-YIG nuclease family protein [Alphaproteobacteria bacterium]|nr:MAG: GIY-YIG nuclease family protein [Alphaproteobacteria bacterium]